MPFNTTSFSDLKKLFENKEDPYQKVFDFSSEEITQPNQNLKNTDRYPYTYAADYIRKLAGNDSQHGYTKISRSDASIIYGEIAVLLNIDKKILAEKLADKYIENIKD